MAAVRQSGASAFRTHLTLKVSIAIETDTVHGFRDVILCRNKSYLTCHLMCVYTRDRLGKTFPLRE